jgi:hypothetical protein
MMSERPKAKSGPKEFGSDSDPNYTPTLAEAGIDKNLANSARKLGALSDEEFERTVVSARDAVVRVVKNVTSSAAIASTADKRSLDGVDQGCTVDDLSALISAGRKFSVIYADPPWSFAVYSGKGKQRSADRHYATMSLDDIKALPISDLADEDCALPNVASAKLSKKHKMLNGGNGTLRIDSPRPSGRNRAFEDRLVQTERQKRDVEEQLLDTARRLRELQNTRIVRFARFLNRSTGR